MSQTYDPKRVVVTFGVTPLDGFADGDAIMVEFNAPGTTTKVGIAGEYAFNESADRSGLVRLRLMQTSGTNALLAALYAAGNLPLPISVTSLSSAELFVAAKAKIQRIPNKAFGAEVGAREWVLVFGEGTVIS